MNTTIGCSPSVTPERGSSHPAIKIAERPNKPAEKHQRLIMGPTGNSDR
ncbi:hypothetical protein [Crateriforma conspicua]|nr:hypothetical protein [Crateriforma conspicua]